MKNQLKKLFLAGGLLGAALPGFGQGRDTAFAIRKLFRQKRGSAERLESFRDSSSNKEYRAQRAGSPLTGQEIRQNALSNTAFTIAGMVKGATYSAEEEEYVLRLCAAGQPIPPHIRRRLKRKHFHRSAEDVLAGY